MKALLKSLKNSMFNLLLIAAAVMATMHYVGYKSDKKLAQQIDRNSPLTENQMRRLIVDLLRDQIILQQKDKTTKVYSGVRKAVFTQDLDGEIDMYIPTRGWTFEPGMTLVAGSGTHLGIDLQWAYWRRWGLVTGITVNAINRTFNTVRAHAGVSYNIPNKFFPNTSFWGGVDTSGDPVLGIRTRF